MRPMTTRAQAIEELEAGQLALDTLMLQLSYEQMVVASSIGGGEWSAKDLLAHIAGWEETALASLEEWRARRRPWIEDIFARAPEGVDELNAENDRHGATQSMDETRLRADGAHRRLLAEITAMSDEEWNAHAWYPTERRRTLERLLGSVLGGHQRPFGHVFDHLPDLHAYATSTTATPPRG
jgi:hypothetical protein